MGIKLTHYPSFPLGLCQEPDIVSVLYPGMDEMAKVYTQRATEFEQMAEEALSEQLRIAYRELAKGYRALAAHHHKPRDST